MCANESEVVLMRIQSVENTNSSIGFGSKKKDNVAKASAFVNMDDSQLRTIAYINATDKKTEKKQQNTITGMFYSLPIIDTIASGILVDKSNKLTKSAYKALKSSPLSTRAEAAAKTAGIWGVILVVVGLFNAFKKAIGKQSPELREYGQEHPIGSFILDIGAIFGVLALGGLALKKFAPEKVEELKSKFKNSIDKLDDTKFNKETLPKIVKTISGFAKKAPKLAKAGRIALVNSVWIFLGASILKSISYSAQQQKKVEQNYQALKQKQFEAAKYVANTVGVERDILAQNQVELMKELRNQMNKSTKPLDKESVTESVELTKEETVKISKTHHPDPED